MRADTARVGAPICTEKKHMTCESPRWQIVAHAHNQKWGWSDPRASASAQQEIHSLFMPDGTVSMIEGNSELEDALD